LIDEGEHGCPRRVASSRQYAYHIMSEDRGNVCLGEQAMQAQPDTGQAPIRIGISSCLLGEQVRFDKGHKRDAFIVETLGQFFSWTPVCPEMEIGLGTPRESLRLIGDAAAPKLIAPKSQRDHTDTMQQFATDRLTQLEDLELHGYILKKGSPSCGMSRVRVYGNGGIPQRHGQGLFARALMERFPLLPVEEEGRLHDMALRENFIERIFAYYRWRQFVASNPTPREVVRFHTQTKMALLAHSRSHYQALGRLAAQAGSMPLDDVLRDYGQQFMAGLKVKATRKKHANVLSHLQGHLKKHLDAVDKAEFVACIDAYREGLVPLVVPLTLLQHHFRRHPSPWVEEQTYLNPYPAELMLRNHV
jgi:uncharacterized protein YbgA (DUF1722 family)/uncharacterized protein YbbK (DUF523 family)